MVIPLLQVVQAGVDLAQHGVDGCLYCFSGEVVVFAFRVDIHRHTLFHVASRQVGSCTHMANAAVECVAAHWAQRRLRQGGWREVVKTLCSLKSSFWGKESKTVMVCPD